MDKVERVSVALPPLSNFAPIIVVPSLNVTHPVGVVGADEVTVAVKLTACPKADGFTLALTKVDVGYRLTICWTVPKLPINVSSPA